MRALGVTESTPGRRRTVGTTAGGTTAEKPLTIESLVWTRPPSRRVDPSARSSAPGVARTITGVKVVGLASTPELAVAAAVTATAMTASADAPRRCRRARAADLFSVLDMLRPP